MTINTQVTTGRFQFSVKLLKQRMLHLHLIAAESANEVMMIVPGNLIHQVTITFLRRTRQPILGEELERAVDGRFCQAW